MSQEAALAALRDGDFSRAVDLLEPLVRGNRFSSEMLNHAYTLALHHTGGRELAEVSFDIAKRLARRRPGVAADYFQRAILNGIAQDRIQEVVDWQASLSERGVRRPPAGIRTDRVAHVIGCFLPGHAPSLYVRLLSRSLARLGVRSRVFTTEWTSSWFFNPTGIRQSDPPEVEAEVTVGEIEGDFFERAERVSNAIRESGIDIALYHCGPSEQITVRVAALHPAAVQINVNHAEEVGADLFEGFAHLFQNGLERTRLPDRAKRWIPLISDIEDRLAQARPMTRSELALDQGSTVSGTFGNLFKASEPVFLEALSQILAEHPGHCHLFAGAGDPAPIRAFLSRNNLLDRVRFVAHLPDIAGMLGIIDIYLNSFPVSGGQSVLEPMAAAIPPVIRRYPYATHYNVGAELAGIGEVLADSEDEYVEIADRLLGEPALRQRLGTELQTRFRREFRPEGLGARYVDFFQEVIGRLPDTPV